LDFLFFLFSGARGGEEPGARRARRDLAHGAGGRSERGSSSIGEAGEEDFSLGKA
jgi:hypothetical protein